MFSTLCQYECGWDASQTLGTLGERPCGRPRIHARIAKGRIKNWIIAHTYDNVITILFGRRELLLLAQRNRTFILKELFTDRFQLLLYSHNLMEQFNLKFIWESTKRNEKDEIMATIFHPSNRDFDIVVAVGEEIIIFFNEFHFHHENFSDEEKVLNEVVNDAIAQIQQILTADQITITKWQKGKNVYRNVLEVEHQGQTEVIGNCNIGFRGLLFFIPTRKTAITTAFHR